MHSDRYNYLAIIGILLIVASIPEWLRDRKQALAGTAWAVLCAAGLVFMVKSGMRIRDWQNSLKLIERSMEAAGDNFGKAYLWRGENKKSAPRFAGLTHQNKTKNQLLISLACWGNANILSVALRATAQFHRNGDSFTETYNSEFKCLAYLGATYLLQQLGSGSNG